MEELIRLRNKISELEQTDHLYKETERAGKIGGWQFDPATLKQSWSDQVFRILEMDLTKGAPEVPKGLEFIDPQFRTMAEKAIQRAMEHGEPYNQEWIVTTAKGNKKWVNAVCIPKMKNGKAVTISGSFQDITSKKKMEEELKKSEEKLKKVIDNSPFPIAVVDEKDQTILFWSEKAIQLFGHIPKTTEEWYNLAYPNPKYRQAVIKRWKPFLEIAQNTRKAINTGEYKICCKNGSEKICELYAQFIPGSLIVTLNDITERKNSEEQLKALNQQLLANEQQLRAANQQLQAGEQQLKAANQQLSASEQQLIATNQQLLANEQQLRAANQQLQANEQELLAANQQLKASEKQLKEANKNLLEAKEKAEENEEKYRTLFNSMQEGIYLHRLVYNDQGKAKNYRIIDANDISEKHLEIKKIDAIGKLATELFKTEEAPFLEEYSKVAETGESYSFEQYFDPMDKHFSISVFSPKKGDFATLFIDITEKKRIETALKESEERQRLIIKGLNDAPWDWDLIKDELFYSPQWCQQLGYKPNEIPPNSSLWERLMHPDDKPEVDKIFNGALTKGQESYEVEFRLKHKKGHYVPVLSRGFITFDENKKPIRVSGTNLDLSERKKIELELIKAKEIAEKSEKYLENILENIADPIFVKDEESKLLQVNEAFCKLFGLNKENIIGKDLAEDVSPSERESFLRIDKMVLNSGEENINEESLTVHGGQTKIISTKKSRFLDEKGGKFLIGIIRDITGGKQKEIELLNAKVKAEENEAKYRELFNNVGDAIFIYDPDTYEIFEANKATSDIYGYSHEELIGMSCLKFSAKVEKFKSGAKSIKNQEKININFRHHKKKDGTDLFVELTTYNISVNGKNIVYSVCHDISDIKKTEAELIKHQNNLEELVSQRTIELELINRDLENFNKLFVGREFRIKELRDQVNELKSQIRKLQS